MSDIVERLRHHARFGDGWTRPVAGEAADEIERLRHSLIDTRLERDHARRMLQAARREGIAAAATELRASAARLRRMDPVDLQVLSNAATLEQAADALAELPAARKPTGLEYRGG
jgi:hypothetical protein